MSSDSILPRLENLPPALNRDEIVGQTDRNGTHTGEAHGVVIVDSLQTGCLPPRLDLFVERKYQYWLGGSRLTTIALLRIPAEDIRDIAQFIAELLRPRGFYAHIVRADRLYLIFPNAVREVVQSDASGLVALRRVGTRHGIPADQMRFEDLFTTDHPSNPTGICDEEINVTEYFSPTTSTCDLLSQHLSEACICARVLGLTDDGITAELLSDGVTIHAEFPKMPGPSLGDIIGCKGRILYTEGTSRFEVRHWTVLTPTWHPEFFQQDFQRLPREIVLLRDRSLRHALDIRRQVTRGIRAFLDNRGFVEMDTPIILPVRDIAPVPHFSVLPSRNGRTVLRICPENALKRLVVSGFDRVYEIARNFRVEESSHHRSCEFTTLECYQAYATYNDLMNLCQDLIRAVVQAVNGNANTLLHGNEQIDMGAPWSRRDFQTAVLCETGIDLDRLRDYQSLLEAMKARAIDIRELRNRRECINRLAEFVENTIVQPTFLVDHPAETICVAQRHGAPRSHLLERFELFIAGMEIAHAFSELTNPMEQRDRMGTLMGEKINVGEEEHQLDEDFLTALEIGLPPTGGLGIGIDRLVMLLTGEPIDRVVSFPVTI